jgi:Flp pilus assembly protein TadD
MRRHDAVVWFETAQAGLRTGQTDAAVVALRNAVAKDPDNRSYRLALAGTLAGAGGDDEARRLLLSLRDVQPGGTETSETKSGVAPRG